MQKYLHISEKSSNFAPAKCDNSEMMNTEDSKQAPIGTESTGVGMPQQMYFTADEAMAFLEPRIRAMFK